MLLGVPKEAAFLFNTIVWGNVCHLLVPRIDKFYKERGITPKRVLGKARKCFRDFGKKVKSMFSLKSGGSEAGDK